MLTENKKILGEASIQSLPLSVGSESFCQATGKLYCQFNIINMFNLFIQHIAYGGDITCDFESQFWYRGHCNWIYSGMSENTFQWISDQPNSMTRLLLGGI